jgi:cytochrome c oxidase subunit III
MRRVRPCIAAQLRGLRLQSLEGRSKPYLRMMTTPKQSFQPRPGIETIGMWLFLISLTMLFAATMVGYVIVRIRLQREAALGSLDLPASLWISTALILAGSVTIHQALVAVRRERQQALRHYLVFTCAFAASFAVVQAPSLVDLLRQHDVLRVQGVHVYGLIYFMILLHALHVLGGILGLGVVTFNAFQRRYDHERHGGVKRSAMYWHFLDAVWLVMFGTMLMMG